MTKDNEPEILRAADLRKPGCDDETSEVLMLFKGLDRPDFYVTFPLAVTGRVMAGLQTGATMAAAALAAKHVGAQLKKPETISFQPWPADQAEAHIDVNSGNPFVRLVMKGGIEFRFLLSPESASKLGNELLDRSRSAQSNPNPSGPGTRH